jgi:hypothetical protein
MENKNMKHNKKRNTAFLYETLLREGTKAAIEKDLEKAKLIKNFILEHFNKSTEMYKELDLFNCLKENSVEEQYAKEFLEEAKRRYDKIDKIKLFNEQTKIINKINKFLGFEVYNNFLPNYKDLATIEQIFNGNLPIKEKILLEQSIVNKIKIVKEDKIQNKQIEHADNILFTTFSKKFNEKYSSLLSEQKELLTRYVSSFSDGDLDLKIYLNEEIGRLKNKINDAFSAQDISSDKNMIEKTKKVSQFLEDFKTTKELSQDMLQKVLKIQQFVHEVSN